MTISFFFAKGHSSCGFKVILSRTSLNASNNRVFVTQIARPLIGSSVWMQRLFWKVRWLSNFSVFPQPVGQLTIVPYKFCYWDWGQRFFNNRLNRVACIIVLYFCRYLLLNFWAWASDQNRSKFFHSSPYFYWRYIKRLQHATNNVPWFFQNLFVL